MSDTKATFKYIRCLIEFSKERPPMYGGSPEGLETMWYWLDVVLLSIIGRDGFDYSMCQHLSDEGFDMGAMNLSNYLRNVVKIKDDKMMYQRMVELRNQYDQWLMDELVKEDKELSSLCAQFDYKSFFEEYQRNTRKRANK
jgi:hypothetical protein